MNLHSFTTSKLSLQNFARENPFKIRAANRLKMKILKFWNMKKELHDVSNQINHS